ncbi:MAG: CAP domain-containing protein [Sandaracinaceae bacterium]
MTRFLPSATTGLTALLVCACGGGGGPDPEACQVPSPAAFCAPMMVAETIPFEITGSTLDARDDFANDRTVCRTSGAGVPDQTVLFTAPRAGTYDLTTVGSEFDTVLYVLRGAACEGEQVACNDNVAGTRSSALSVELEACETVTVVIDGAQTSSTGSFRLQITGHEELCDDGVDGDGDGALDCADQECLLDPACLNTPDPGGEWPLDWAQNEARMLQLVNQRRSEGAVCGGVEMPPAAPLVSHELLTWAARLHSQDMGAENYFAHQGLDGSSPADRVAEAGYVWARGVGENIAGGSATAESAMQGLMQSPGHCENIMNPSYTHLGVGYAFDPAGNATHYWTQNFAIGGP